MNYFEENCTIAIGHALPVLDLHMTEIYENSYLLIAKLSLGPASAGLRLALFPFDPASQPPTHLPGK